jgi:hypothetical protein
MDDTTSEASISDTSPRKSSETSDSRRTQRGYYFQEHLSQAFTAPPIDLASPPKTPPSSHKHTTSIDSTSSSSSTSKLKRLAESFSRSPKSPSFRWAQRASTDDSVFTVKGSKKTFRKEDIKLGELTSSSNMLHCI